MFGLVPKRRLTSNMNKKALAVLTLLCLAVYFRILDHEFLIWDDDANIYKNYLLLKPLGTALSFFWTNAYYSLYIPVTYTAWAIIGKAAIYFGGIDSHFTFAPKYFHAVSLALHTITSYLVFFAIWHVLRRIRSTEKLPTDEANSLRRDWFWAVLAAAVFMVHPVQVETVAWATGTKDLLSSALAMASLVLYLLFAEKRFRQPSNSKTPWALYAIASICFFLSVLAKPSTVTVPLIVLAVRRGIMRIPIKKDLAWLLPWFAFGGWITIFTSGLQPLALQKDVAAAWARPFVMGDAFAFYYYQIFIPLSYTPVYGRTPSSVLSTGLAFGTALVFFGSAYAAWKARLKRPWCWGAFCIFTVALLPVSGIVTFVFQDISTVADRYLYLPMFGVVFALALALRRTNRPVIKYIALLVVVLLAGRSFFQTAIWKNNLTLFAHADHARPQNFFIKNNYGHSLMEAGRVAEAIPYFQKAIEANPKHERAWTNLGIALRRLKRFEDAARHFETMFQNGFDLPHARNSFALTLLDLNRKSEAFEQFRQAIRQDPTFLDARLNLAQFLFLDGQKEEATLHFEMALKIDPTNPVARRYLNR